MVKLGGSSNGIVVLTLLTKVITFYMKPIIVNIRSRDFEFISK